MANTIIIEIEPCEPPPDLGYEVIYRPQGDEGPYRTWPFLFVFDPTDEIGVIIFTDENDPEGTEFEGFVRGVCLSGKGVDMPWDTGGGSGSASGGDESDEDCDGAGLVVVTNHLAAGTVTAVENIAGFDEIPPPLLAGNSRSGSHTAFTAVVQFTVSGSGANGNAILWKNETIVGCVNITDPGAYFFPEATFETCDIILLSLTPGECD